MAHIYIYIYIYIYIHTIICIYMYLYLSQVDKENSRCIVQPMQSMCICMYMYIRMCICMYMYIRMCICMYMNTRMCICMFMYISRVYLCVYTHKYISCWRECSACVCVVYTNMYICMYVCMCVYIYIYIYIYIYQLHKSDLWNRISTVCFSYTHILHTIAHMIWGGRNEQAY